MEQHDGARPVVAVAICTFRRNGPLRQLLSALEIAASEVRDRANVGVVIVDDNPDGRAQEVAAEYAGSFENGCRYLVSGRMNISIARNIAVENACTDADWIAMIDDDCEPERQWLSEYLEVLARTSADCATGPMKLRPAQGAPEWLVEQPFFEDLRLRYSDGESISVASTNNSIIRAEFLRSNPNLRFDPELGVLGGEDMVFYRTASRQGLSIRFAEFAGVWGNEPAERCTFRHQVRYRFWLGNTEFVTNRYLGDASRFRLASRGARRSIVAPWNLVRRVAAGEPPLGRYTLATIANGLGLVSGALGMEKRHPTDTAAS